MTNANHVFDVFIKTIGETGSLKLSTYEALVLRSFCSYAGEQENRVGISKDILAKHSLQSRKQLTRSLRSLRSKKLIDYKDSLKETIDYRVDVKIMQEYIREGSNKVGLSGRLNSRWDYQSDLQAPSGTISPPLYKNKLKEKLTEKGFAQKEEKSRKEERRGWTKGGNAVEAHMASIKESLRPSVKKQPVANREVAGIDENAPKDVIIESTDTSKNRSSGDGL